jgi:hypothetical protein
MEGWQTKENRGCVGAAQDNLTGKPAFEQGACALYVREVNGSEIPSEAWEPYGREMFGC